MKIGAPLIFSDSFNVCQDTAVLQTFQSGHRTMLKENFQYQPNRKTHIHVSVSKCARELKNGVTKLSKSVLVLATCRRIHVSHRIEHFVISCEYNTVS